MTQRAARDGYLWYFAYGSNLDPDTFLVRRRMRPADALCVCARGHRLAFDLPVGPGERGVANLVPDSGSTTWGVAYEITREQSLWLDRTEGLPKGGYRRVRVAAASADGVDVEAYSYSSPRGVDGRRPSARYMGLILTGARHHGLPVSWIGWLESLDLAVDERRAGTAVR